MAYGFKIQIFLNNECHKPTKYSSAPLKRNPTNTTNTRFACKKYSMPVPPETPLARQKGLHHYKFSVLIHYKTI